MSKTDPSPSDTAAPSARQGHGDALPAEPGARPPRDLDDSWALSASMQVPRLPTEGATETDSSRSDTVFEGPPAAVLTGQPAPPRIPAAAPSGPGTGHEAAASVVARAAALRALGAKTMQGFGPAPINKPQDGPSAPSAPSAWPPGPSGQASQPSPAHPAMTPSLLQEEATHFDSSPAASFEAETVADDERRPLETPRPMPAQAEPPAEAPLYLDDPPDMLRLSTNTSDHAVAPIDPGASAQMPPAAQAASFADASYRESHESGESGESGVSSNSGSGIGGDRGNYRADSEYSSDPSGELPAQDDGSGFSGQEAAFSESGVYPPESGVYPPESGSYSHESGHGHGRDHGHHSAPEAQPPAAQLVAPGGAHRGYGSDSGIVGRADSDWFEASGPQAMADGIHNQPIDHSFDQSYSDPSRLHPRAPNRWIAPLAVFIAVSAVVFAVGYFYYRSQPAQAPLATAPLSAETAQEREAREAAAAAAAGGDGAGGSGGSAATAAGAAAAGATTAAAADAGVVAADLVDVRFDSSPPGAVVMLVDRERGVTSPVGTTPVVAALDPKGAYDAIFTLEGHPTKVVSLDAGKSPRVFAELTGAGAEAAGATAATAAGTGEPKLTGAQGPVAAEDTSSKTGSRLKRPRTPKDRERKNERDPEADEPDEPAAPIEAGAMGRLTVSAKPACEVSINGKAIGRMTPVRDLPLAAGIHKITLTNKELGVNETIAVRVSAGKETKVTQDYTGTP